jgi:hypothetical protein
MALTRNEAEARAALIWPGKVQRIYGRADRGAI